MEHRVLGRTGLRVSVVGFGSIPIRHVPEKEAIDVINRAIDLRINLFHTSYGPQGYGDSAVKIGKVMKERRDECILNVKIFGETRERAESELKKSLEMLNTDRVEIVQFRITEKLFSQGMGEAGGFQALREAQKKGIVDHIGITDHDPKFLAKAIAGGEFSNLIVPFNYVYNGAREELIQLAQKMNVGIVAMKPLGGSKAEGPLKNVSEALNYIWGHGVPTAIVGMRSVKEAEENARIGQKARPLTREQLENLEAIAKELRRKYRVSNGALLPLES